MKYDLLLSDLVALVVGFLGLIASVIALQNAISGAFSGSWAPALAFSLMTLIFFLPARRFLMSRPYQAMLARAWHWQQRIPFVVINSVWIFLVTVFLIGTKPEDLFGIATYVPWLFTRPLALAIWILFAMVFVLPGLAFKPFRQAYCETLDEEDVPEATPGLVTRIRQNQNTILIDVHPIVETALKVIDFAGAGLVVIFCTAFLFSDTHASLDFLDAVPQLIWPTMIVLFLFIYLPKNLGTRIVKETGDILYSTRRKLVNAMLVLGLSFGLAHLPYFYLIPWGYNKVFASENAEIGYTVVNTVDYSFCRRGLNFAYPDDPTRTFHVCEVNDAIRSRVTAGDTVFIRGKISWYGHSAEMLRLRGDTTGA